MSSNRIDGGLDTTHLSAQEQDRIAREQREATALRSLKRRGGLDDIAEMLGLTPYTCLSCGLPMDGGKGWFCQRKPCRSPLVRRQSLAHANRAKES